MIFESLFTTSCRFSLSMASSFFLDQTLHLPPRHLRSPTPSVPKFIAFLLNTITIAPQIMPILPHSVCFGWSVQSFFKTQQIHKVLITLYFNLSSHIALRLLFLVLFKIAISFSRRHHVLLLTTSPTLHISDKLVVSFSLKAFFH